MKNSKEIVNDLTPSQIVKDWLFGNTMFSYLDEIKTYYNSFVSDFKLKIYPVDSLYEGYFPTFNELCEKLSTLMGVEIGFEFDEEFILVYTSNAVIFRQKA